MEEQETTNTNKSDHKNKVPSCMTFLQHWRRCTSATNHFHNYYIYGEFPKCTEEKTNIKTCFQYKANRSEELKDELIEAMEKIDARVNFTEKPSAGVWEFRENPAQDWLKRDT